jgi:hypothetical protein
MKTALVILGVLMVTMVAKAQVAPALPLELCQMDAGVESQEEVFEDLEVLDIKEINSLNPFLLDLINQHLLEEYSQKTLTFTEIKALFSDDGEERFNDLQIITFKSKKTEKVYIQVKTWPGDNPYGIIFEDKTGKVLAYNGDDSISLVDGSSKVSCYKLNKN